MDTTLIIIDSDAELERAQELVVQLMASNDPADRARLEAQAQLVVAYEQKRWPPRRPSLAAMIEYLLDQHGLTQCFWGS
jgi:HTH-type transcriptional regulator/antitoxin HigA